MPLTLTRRKNESLIITVPPNQLPTEIRITVLDEKGNRGGKRMRLRTDCPRSVNIMRAELVGVTPTTTKENPSCPTNSSVSTPSKTGDTDKETSDSAPIPTV